MGSEQHKHYIVHLTIYKDSPVIAEGSAKDILNKFNINDYKLEKARRSKDHLLMGEHYLEFYPINDWKAKVEAEKKKARRAKKRKSKFREHINMIERMLDIYGNTGVYKDFDKVAEALKKDGYIVKRVHEPERVIKYLTKGHKEVFSECEILTLIRKETREV